MIMEIGDVSPVACCKDDHISQIDHIS